MQSGIFSDFVKAIYKNDYLAAITADGKVVYTTDGEVWQVSVLEYEDCKLHDIDFDGSRFILVGSYMGTKTLSNGTTTEKQKGLIVVTSDFKYYEKKEITGGNDYDSCLAVYPKNGKYIVINYSQGGYNDNIYISVGNLSDDGWEKETLMNGVNMNHPFSVAKNSLYMLIAGKKKTGTSSRPYEFNVVAINGEVATEFSVAGCSAKAFECKGELYYISNSSSDNYRFAKLLSSGSDMLISNTIDYMFVDGVYFNECLLFISDHGMLIVKKGESITDKTLDDLLEIAPELTMNFITKAFGQLYIFGNQGVILKSSVETNNEDAVMVQTLSAKKALAEAKIYTDELYAELEARVAALEALKE